VLERYSGVEFSINAICPHRHHLSAKVRAFIDLLVERLAAAEPSPLTSTISPKPTHVKKTIAGL
jgi:hypothetical protein